MDYLIQERDLQELDSILKWRMEVLREVFDLKKGSEYDSILAANEKSYRQGLEDGYHKTFALMADGKQIGCGDLCLQKELPSPDNRSGSCGYLMNIYVLKPYRNKGAGRFLVESIVGWAREHEIEKIYLESSHAARDLYREIGFEDLKDYMKLSDSEKSG